MMQEFKNIDEKLFRLSKKIKTLYYIEPINKEEEKEKFLSGKENPKFKYREIEYNTEGLEQELSSIKIPNYILSDIYKKIVDELLLQNKIIKNLGNSNIVKQASAIINNTPLKELVNYAEEILKKNQMVEYQKTISAQELKKVLEKTLADYKLNNWSVELTDKWLTDVKAAENKISICKYRKFSEQELKQLPVHEIGIHVLRAMNGYEQPLTMFAIGLPGYLSTEEGLSLYAEELTGNLSPNKLIDYAARVIAVDSVIKGLTFRETFSKLKSHGLLDEDSWNTTLRVYRGGGYIKDHVYLEGYLKIKKFAKENGDFKALFLGKIGIENLLLIKELLKQGILKPAKYIPDFFKTPQLYPE